MDMVMDMNAEQIVMRFRQLQSQRKSMDDVLNDIDHYVVPYRGEFFNDMLTEHQVQWHRTQIYDSTAIVDCDLLASRVHGDFTSPVTKWFDMRFRDDDMNDDAAAKEWLEDCSERVWQALVESDFDTNAAEMYTDITSFGTSILTEEPKDDLVWKGIDFTALPIMDSYFEMGPDDIPYAIYRRLRYTRIELEGRFPDMPEDIKLDDEQSKNSSVDAKFEVVFCIYPRNDNPLFREGKAAIYTPEDRPFGYQYVLLNSKTELEQGGYYQFPGMVVRWDKVAGAKWGTSPAMRLLSDIKQLNELVAQTSEARAKAIDPPQKTTSRGVIGDLDMEPGGLTVVEEMDELAPLQTGSDFPQADAERERLQESIHAGFYRDLLDLKESPAMTATEVNARIQKMLRYLSRTFGRLKTDFFSPLIQNTFLILLRYDQLLPQPESVAGMELDIQYTGPMQTAQKAEVAMGISQWLMDIAALIELYPDMADIPDTDQAAKTLAELRGVPAKVVRTDAEIEATRKERNERQQAMEQLQAAEQAGKAMKAAGEGVSAMPQGEETLQ